MEKAYQVMPDIEILPSYFPVPGAGFLSVNAFVLKAKEPVLIDTGMGIDSEEFMKVLESVIDPRDLKWVSICGIHAFNAWRSDNLNSDTLA